MGHGRPVATSLIALALLAPPLAAQNSQPLQDPQPTQDTQPSPVTQPSQAAQLSGRDTGGVLRAGDVIRVKVWREPDLSGDFTVDEHESVVLPKLGAVSVAGRSPAALKDTLMSGYAVYLRNPSIEVTFLRRITVLGAVRAPGLYTVDPTVTVAGAVAMAGGVAPNGNTGRVDLLRDDTRVAIDLEDPDEAIATGLRSGDRLVVPQRSWLSRNPWLIAVAISTTAGFVRLAID